MTADELGSRMTGVELVEWGLLEQIRTEERERAGMEAELLADAAGKMDAREE